MSPVRFPLWGLGASVLLSLAVGERIERQVRFHRAQQQLAQAKVTVDDDLEVLEPSASKRKYVQEKMAIEREVVAPFVAKAHEIPAADTAGKQKMAFIFLTMKDLQWPELWDRFFADAPVGDYSIYVHQALAKPGSEPMPLPLEKFGAISVPWVKTAWCALFGVEVATLFEALKDPTNAQFVFISDSTVPLKSYAYVHQELMGKAKDDSRVCLAEPASFPKATTQMLKAEATRSCVFRDFLRKINPRTLKHHQWLTLARRHAATVVKYAEAGLDVYEKAWVQAAPDLGMGEGCSDEAVPIIALLASMDAEQTTSGNTWQDLTRLGVEQECLTYVRWRNCFAGTELDLTNVGNDLISGLKNIKELHDMITKGDFDFMKSNMKRELNGFPHLFSNITERYLWSMVSQGFMFARKFTEGIQVKMNGREVSALGRFWETLQYTGSPTFESSPLVDVLPAMWADVNFTHASVSTWSHLETDGQPAALRKP